MFGHRLRGRLLGLHLRLGLERLLDLATVRLFDRFLQLHIQLLETLAKLQVHMLELVDFHLTLIFRGRLLGHLPLHIELVQLGVKAIGFTGLTSLY